MTQGGIQLSWNGELARAYRWPNPVGAGGVLGLFAPAGGYDPEELKRGVAVLRSWGFEVKMPKNLNRRQGYLAGPVDHRLNILTELMEDETVDGLMAVRGGFGSQHLLPQLAPKWPKWPAKPIYGFSDLTALHLARLKSSGVVGYHSPMVISLGKSDPALGADRLSRENLRQVLLGGGHTGQWSFAPKNILKSGEAQGVLWGGNLTLVCALLSSPWLPDFSGSILMLEEVDEPAYRLDRLLTTLKQSPLWNQARALVFGGLTRCGAPPKVRRLLQEVAADFPGPVLANAPFSHLSRNLVFPMGAVGMITMNL